MCAWYLLLKTQKTVSKRSVCQALSLSVCSERCRDCFTLFACGRLHLCAYALAAPKLTPSLYKRFMCQLACWSSHSHTLGACGMFAGSHAGPGFGSLLRARSRLRGVGLRQRLVTAQACGPGSGELKLSSWRRLLLCVRARTNHVQKEVLLLQLIRFGA